MGLINIFSSAISSYFSKTKKKEPISSQINYTPASQPVSRISDAPQYSKITGGGGSGGRSGGGGVSTFSQTPKTEEVKIVTVEPTKAEYERQVSSGQLTVLRRADGTTTYYRGGKTVANLSASGELKTYTQKGTIQTGKKSFGFTKVGDKLIAPKETAERFKGKEFRTKQQPVYGFGRDSAIVPVSKKVYEKYVSDLPKEEKVPTGLFAQMGLEKARERETPLAPYIFGDNKLEKTSATLRKSIFKEEVPFFSKQMIKGERVTSIFQQERFKETYGILKEGEIGIVEKWKQRGGITYRKGLEEEGIFGKGKAFLGAAQLGLAQDIQARPVKYIQMGVASAGLGTGATLLGTTSTGAALIGSAPVRAGGFLLTSGFVGKTGYDIYKAPTLLQKGKIFGIATGQAATFVGGFAAGKQLGLGLARLSPAYIPFKETGLEVTETVPRITKQKLLDLSGKEVTVIHTTTSPQYTYGLKGKLVFEAPHPALMSPFRKQFGLTSTYFSTPSKTGAGRVYGVFSGLGGKAQSIFKNPPTLKNIYYYLRFGRTTPLADIKYETIGSVPKSLQRAKIPKLSKWTKTQVGRVVPAPENIAGLSTEAQVVSPVGTESIRIADPRFTIFEGNILRLEQTMNVPILQSMKTKGFDFSKLKFDRLPTSVESRAAYSGGLISSSFPVGLGSLSSYKYSYPSSSKIISSAPYSRGREYFSMPSYPRGYKSYVSRGSYPSYPRSYTSYASYASYPSYPRYKNIISTTRTPPPLLPSLDLRFDKKYKKHKFKLKQRRYEYRPSLIGVMKGLTTKKAPKQLSGLMIRPIQTGGKRVINPLWRGNGFAF